MGMELVAAAGSMAGGMAAKAIMGTPQPIGPDTSVPGISKAVIQKGSKGKPEKAIAQVNASPAIDYFKQAAESFSQSATTGLNLYNTAIQQAINEFTGYDTPANKALNSIIVGGNAATDQYMKMLGLGAQTTQSNTINQLKSMGYNDLASQLNTSGTNLAPDQLNAMADKIRSQGGTDIQKAQGDIASLQNALDNIGPPPTATPMAITVNGMPVNRAIGGKDGSPSRLSTEMAAYNSKKSDLEEAIRAAQGRLETAQSNQTILNDMATNYARGITEAGSAGDSVTQMLQNTPGYQFNLQQGLQASTRASLAGGLGGSGNALAAAAKYASGLAENTYQGYMNNLAGVMGMGTSAAQNQAGSVASLYGNIGSAALNTYSNIGQANYNALTNSGQTLFNASMANMQAQNAAIAQEKQMQSQQQMAYNQNQLQAGYLNLAANQFNYQVAQNQQAGQAFYQNTGSSGAGGYPYYNNQTGTWQI